MKSELEELKSTYHERSIIPAAMRDPYGERRSDFGQHHTVNGWFCVIW